MLHDHDPNNFVSAAQPETPAEMDQGASLVEYALLAALIAVVCVIAIQFLGKAASDRFSRIASSVGST